MDSNGRLSAEGLRQGLASLSTPSSPETIDLSMDDIDQIIAFFERNGNKGLSFVEFKQVMEGKAEAEIKARLREQATRALERLMDQVQTMAESDAEGKTTKECLADLFAEADTDGSGTL